MKTNSTFSSPICCLLALFLLLAFSGCHDKDEISFPSPRVKKITNYQDNKVVSESTYRYDAAGRIIKVSSTMGDNNSSLQYAYLPGKVIVTITGSQIKDVETDTLLLNAEGLQIDGSPSSSTEYDAQGYLVSRLVANNGVRYLNTFKIEDGNTVQWLCRRGDQFEDIVVDQRYEFLPNSTNTIGEENFGRSFMGRQDINLQSKVTSVTHDGDRTSENTVSFEYELDARNRVVKESTGEPGSYAVITYYN